jgi:hypothetical protein
MVCFIHLHETLNLLIIVIVIGLEIVMIGFVFCSDEQHLHSLLRNNLLIVALSTCETDYVAFASCVCSFIREHAKKKQLRLIHVKISEQFYCYFHKAS